MPKNSEKMSDQETQELSLPVERKVGKYILGELLGRGGMGEVWKSHHPGLQIPVAIKLLNPKFVSKSENFQSRFIQEGTLAATINHQNIVRVFDAGNDEEQFYLVMELIQGDDYEKVFQKNGQALSPDAVLEMLLAICDALATSHKKGIIHRTY